jgi:hypothetical protein
MNVPTSARKPPNADASARHDPCNRICERGSVRRDAITRGSTGMSTTDDRRPTESHELDARLAVPKDDTRLLWLFTTVLVLLAVLVPYVGRANLSALPDSATPKPLQALTANR